MARKLKLHLRQARTLLRQLALDVTCLVLAFSKDSLVTKRVGKVGYATLNPKPP